MQLTFDLAENTEAAEAKDRRKPLLKNKHRNLSRHLKGRYREIKISLPGQAQHRLTLRGQQMHIGRNREAKSVT